MISSVGEHCKSIIANFQLASLDNTFVMYAFISYLLQERHIQMRMDSWLFLILKAFHTHQHCPHLGQMCKGDVKGNMHEKYNIQ